jgi:hypothetical protein
MGTTLQPLPIHRPIIFTIILKIKFKYFHPSPYHFHYYFESNSNIFVNGEIRTRNLSLAHTLLYHYTTISIMSIFRFHSTCTITNREQFDYLRY